MGVALIILSVGYFLQPHIESDSLENRPEQNPQKPFSAICDCAILSTGTQGSFALNTETNQEISLSVVSGTQQPSGYIESYLSPNSQTIAAITHQGRQIDVLTNGEENFSTLYTALQGQEIKLLLWSVDSKYVVAGIRAPKDSWSNTVEWPTFFILVRVADKHTTVVLDNTQYEEISNQSMQPLAISSDGTTVLFFQGDVGQQEYFVWKKSVPKLSRVNLSIAWTIYFAKDNVNGGEILWYINSTLHRLNIYTLKETKVHLPAFSDGPISPVSPDGHRIVYLQKIDQQQAGKLTLLNLLDGSERLLSDVPIDLASGLANAVWTPDGSFLVYPNFPSSPQTYEYIQSTNEGQAQAPTELQPLPALGEQVITGFYPLNTVSDGQTTMQQLTLRDLDEPDLTVEQQAALESQIENWSLYTTDTKTKIGDSNCQHPSAAQQLAAIDAAGKRSLNLNDAFLLTITPNVYHWNTDKLQTFGDGVVCGVGTTAPRVLVDGYIVWWMGNCVGGVTPTKSDTPAYHELVRCIQAEEVVNKHFHQEEFIQ